MSSRISDDANDILGWLDVHCVKVSEGAPASVLQQRWLATHRDPEGLRQALEWLFAEGLIGLTPGLETPHVRFSVRGYERLLALRDPARPASDPVAAVPTPTAAVIDPETMPTGSGIRASAATRAGQALDQAPPSRFLDPRQPLTEIGLRNQVLHVYRDLKAKAGHQIVAMTLSRYWQEMGLRNGDLRLGIDLLVRDGYLKYSSHRNETHWVLTEAGYAYTRAPLTPRPLLERAGPMPALQARADDEELRRAALRLFQANPVELRSIESLEAAWPGEHDNLLHALDLLWKDGRIELRLGETLSVALTEDGRDWCARHGRKRLFGLG